MRTISHIAAGLIVAAALGGCGGRPAPIPPESSGTPATENAATQVEPVLTSTGAATDIPTIPTPSAPMQIWPLDADLFYLNDVGQVWRQPLLGDDSLAAAVTPLKTTVRDFAVAPGGGWLIYRTDDTIATTSLDGRQGQVIAQNVGLPTDLTRGQTVTWSPDAGKLAYITSGGFQVMIPGAGQNYEPLIYAVAEDPLIGLGWSANSDWLLAWRVGGGAALYSVDPLAKWVDIGRINGFAWLADGRLAFAPVEGGLALLTPGDVSSRAFLVPQDRQIDLPAQQPDGTLVFFGHSGSIDQPGFLYVSNPSDKSFSIKGTTPVDTAGLLWNPAATRLVGRDPRQPGTARLLDPLTGASATFKTSGEVRRFDWADPPPRGVSGMALPADLYYLAPQAGVVQVWRLPRSGDPPSALTTASADITGYDVSGDGTQIVYVSNGTITLETISTGQTTQVAQLSVLAQAGTPAIASDGHQVAYADQGIHIWDAATGKSRRVLADRLPQSADDKQVQSYDLPQWSIDGNWLLVRVTFYEGYDTALLSLTEPGAKPILLDMYNAGARWIDVDRALVFRPGGAYGEPFLNLVQPGSPPTTSRLADSPVLDAVERDDGRIAFLRVPPPGFGGPTSVRVVSVLPNGSDLKVETGYFVLEQPALSPGGGLIAGLAEARTDEFGLLTGQLVLADTASGSESLIESATGIHDLQWGR